MICFRDMTFCNAPCANVDCRRRLTDAVIADARRWWGKEGAPIAVANFAERDCVEYSTTPTGSKETGE